MKQHRTVAMVGLVVLLACSGGRASDETATTTDAQRPAAATKPAPKPAAPAVSADPAVRAAAFKAFQDRVREYLNFHNNVEKMVPPLTETSNPQKIADRERALGEQLIKSRPDAKPGDFFIKQVQPYLIEIIHQDFAKRALADRKALIVELPKGVKFGVNQIYPTTIPLATFPPNLLKTLPDLPPELEYRIVFRDLILRDAKANVVVDVMPNVFPIPK